MMFRFWWLKVDFLGNKQLGLVENQAAIERLLTYFVLY